MSAQNIGETDRAFRIVGGMLLLLYAVISLSGTAQALVAIFSLALMVTGMVGYCALYSLLGMNTCEVPVKKAKKVAIPVKKATKKSKKSAK